jgi:hypothetical protein
VSVRNKTTIKILQPNAEQVAPDTGRHRNERSKMEERKKAFENIRKVEMTQKRMAECPQALLTGQRENLDISKGMKRFKGNEPAYMEALDAFCAHVGRLINRLEKQDETDIENYARIMRGIMCAGIGIGSDSIAHFAETLEQAARSGDRMRIRSDHEVFISRVEQLLVEIDAYKRRSAHPGHRPQLAEPDGILLLQLREACALYSLGEVDAIIEELNRYSYMRMGDMVDLLTEMAENIDYDGIRELLTYRPEARPC